jgi:hypothetical protein
MDDIRDRFIEKVAAGKRFVDIGGLWGMVNEKATVAAAAGASEVTMLDAMEEGHETWHQFAERARARNVDARCVTANLDASETVATFAGQFRRRALQRRSLPLPESDPHAHAVVQAVQRVSGPDVHRRS